MNRSEVNYKLRIAFCLTLLPLFQSCGLKNVFFDFAADLVPPEMIRSIDQQGWQEISSQRVVLNSPEANALLEKLAQPILQRITAPAGVEWQFHVIVSPELNAFALPGGTIGINSGLILSSSTGNELLGVIAHEIGHVTEQHGLNSVITQTGLSVAFSLFLGEADELTRIAVGQLSRLGLLKFSRDQEREADRVGSLTLQQAQLPSEGLHDFFARFANRRSDQSIFMRKAEGLLSTHPVSEERARYLKNLAQENPHDSMPASLQQLNESLKSVVYQRLSNEQQATHSKVRNIF